jgi:hypothetical protein
MDPVTIDDVLGALGGFTAEERAQVAAACSVLGTRSEKAQEADAAAHLLWSGYSRFAEQQGQPIPPAVVAEKMAAWATLRSAAQRLDPWVISNFGARDETERRAAWRVVARCIMRWMHDQDRDWTPTALMQQAGNAPAAVDSQFPGYARAGVLTKVLT